MVTIEPSELFVIAYLGFPYAHFLITLGPSCK